MSFHYDRMVIGYHGCRREVAEGLLAGGRFQSSRNAWDWLGEGAYFWEFGFQRAADWATSRYEDPAVVGAVIQLGNCLDLLDTRGAFIQRESHIQVAVRELSCIVGVFRPLDAPSPIVPEEVSPPSARPRQGSGTAP